jgi:hypothetical protein
VRCPSATSIIYAPRLTTTNRGGAMAAEDLGSLLQTPPTLRPLLEEIRAEVASARRPHSFQTQRGFEARVDFEGFDWMILFRETAINMGVPFSLPLVLWAEGLDGLRRRDLWGYSKARW